MRNGIAKPSKSQALNKEQKIKRCRSGNSAPLFYPIEQRISAKSEAILRRQELARIRCRGEHCSPVLGVCCKFRIVGDDALGVPLGGILLYFLYL